MGKVPTAVYTIGCVTPFKRPSSVVECMCVSCAHGCDSCPLIMIMDDANHKTEKISVILPTFMHLCYSVQCSGSCSLYYSLCVGFRLDRVLILDAGTPVSTCLALYFQSNVFPVLCCSLCSLMFDVGFASCLSLPACDCDCPDFFHLCVSFPRACKSLFTGFVASVYELSHVCCL